MSNLHYSLWHQGRKPIDFNKCTGDHTPTCPESYTTAGEYGRGFYTHTGVLNPNIDLPGSYEELPITRLLNKVEASDYLWLVLIPPHHRILDVFMGNSVTLSPASTLESFAGITVSLVTGVFRKMDETTKECKMESETYIGTLTFPSGTDLKPQMLTSNQDITTDHETWIGVGIKVDSLPKDKTLADIYGRLFVGAHTLAFDAQVFQ